MRRSKEILILLALFAGTVAFVIWYVADRRAQNRQLPLDPKVAGPVIGGEGVEVQSADGKTLDLSTGRAVVSESPEDRAAIAEAMKDIEEALKAVTFGPEDFAPIQATPDPKQP